MAVRYPRIIVGIIFSVVSCWIAPGFGQEGWPQAPELRAQAWVNTVQVPEELTLARLKGHVVVLVFFVVDDSNSIAALDQARQLWDASRFQGVTIIGVHSPPEGWNPRLSRDPVPAPQTAAEGSRGQDRVRLQLMQEHQRRLGHVQHFADRRRIPFPILVDHDRALWDRYRNIAYPTCHVIDHEGVLRATSVGTRSYQQLSSQVAALVSDQARAQADQARKAAQGPPVPP